MDMQNFTETITYKRFATRKSGVTYAKQQRATPPFHNKSLTKTAENEIKMLCLHISLPTFTASQQALVRILPQRTVI